MKDEECNQEYYILHIDIKIIPTLYTYPVDI